MPPRFFGLQPPLGSSQWEMTIFDPRHSSAIRPPIFMKLEIYNLLDSTHMQNFWGKASLQRLILRTMFDWAMLTPRLLLTRTCNINGILTIKWSRRDVFIRSGNSAVNATAAAAVNSTVYQCCSGLCIDLLNMLSEKIGLEFDLFEVPDRKFGSYKKIGTTVKLALFNYAGCYSTLSHKSSKK